MHLSQLAAGTGTKSSTLQYVTPTPIATTIPGAAVMERKADTTEVSDASAVDAVIQRTSIRPTFSAKILNPFDYPITSYSVDSSVFAGTGVTGMYKALKNVARTEFSFVGQISTYTGDTDVNGVSHTDTLVSWKSGSFGKETDDRVGALITAAGAYDVSKLSLFSSRNPFVRNASCWCSSLNWTGCSPSNSFDGVRRAGTAITRQHVVFATHYSLPVGTTLTFIANDNSVVTRVLLNVTAFANNISVGTLDSELPESIVSYRIMPSNWREHAPSRHLGYRLIALDQEDKALCFQSWYDAPAFSASNDNTVGFKPYPSWSESLVSGDSGNPTFLLLDYLDPVLLSVHTYPSSGPDIAAQAANIEQALGTSLDYVDLSAYSSY